MVYISFLISHVPPAHSFFQKKSILINPTQNLVQLIFLRLLSRFKKKEGWSTRNQPSILNHNILFSIMNMPSGWKTGTHEIVQDLNILALKSLLELLLSICVGFRKHPWKILMAQVMKSISNCKEFFQLYRFSLSGNRYFRIIQSMGATFTKHAAQGDSLPFLKQTVHKNVIFKENLLFFYKMTHIFA